MKSIAELVSIALLSGLLASCASEQRTTVNSDRIVTNPIDLNYRFQPNEESRREAADPVLEYFKGYYYIEVTEQDNGELSGIMGRVVF